MGAVLTPDRLAIVQANVVQRAGLHAGPATDAGVGGKEGICFHVEFIEALVDGAAFQLVQQANFRGREIFPLPDQLAALLQNGLCLGYDGTGLPLAGALNMAM